VICKNKAAAAALFIVFIVAAGQTVDFSVFLLIQRGSRFFDIFWAMLPPDTVYAVVVLQPLWATVQMSLAGTAIGAICGFIGAFVTNAYNNQHWWLRISLKGIIHFIRTIPVLILALICTFLFGLGTLAGTIALALYTFAVMTRMGYEDIESMSFITAQTLEAAGCGRTRAFIRTILPAVLPGYMTNVLYILEANVRHAAILGYVGAGGIGILLNEQISWRQYSQVGMILLLLYVVVLSTEGISEWLRRVLRGARKLTLAERLAVWSSVVFFAGTSLLLLSFPYTDTSGFSAARAIMEGMIHPDFGMLFSLEYDGVPYLLYETFCIAFLGTLAGMCMAAVFSFTANFRLFPWPAALLARLVLLFIRTVPVFVYGLMWIRVTGPGPFAGVLTLAVCSIGLLAKRFIIAIDDMDFRTYRAYTAMGVSFLGKVKYVILPQIYPRYVSAVMYRFDINIRDAAVLGLVGAGGIGTPLMLAMMHYNWSEAGALLWGLMLLVTGVEIVSEQSRKKSGINT
jgi:phosphonate transport system permease protein